MEMTKQRKMLIGVLAVGLLGLVVDRMFLAAPESAAADDSEVIVVEPDGPTPPSLPGTQPRQAPAAAGTADQSESSALPSYASLTERLVQAQQQASETDSGGRADPFALPSQWQADRSKPSTQPETQRKATGQRLTMVFTLDGTVRSVIDGKEELMAVISGGGLDSRAVRVGQKIRVANEGGERQEYVLVEVGPRYVVWLNQSTKERIEMRVDEVL